MNTIYKTVFKACFSFLTSIKKTFAQNYLSSIDLKRSAVAMQ
jgi:hypothetical protein